MPKDLNYSQQRAQEITLLTREVLPDLPAVCTDFLRAIEPTTQPLTRYAYACDLRLFFQYLQSEVPRFAGKAPANWTCAELANVTARDISMYLEYLSLYYKDRRSRHQRRTWQNAQTLVAAQLLPLFVQKRIN